MKSKRLKRSVGLLIIKSVFFLCLMGSSRLIASTSKEKINNELPNIIVILTDDQGYGDLSCYDNPGDIHTPNIDKLAIDGVKFTHGYANHSVCGPTRAGLMSGRYQQRFGVHSNKHVLGNAFSSQMSMAEALKKCGYTTGIVGKWHLGRFKKEQWPTSQGFDEYYGFLKGMRAYFGKTPNNPIYRNEKPIGATEGEYLTDEFNREAVSFIERNSEKGSPFFLYLPYNAPHYPMQAKEEYLKKFKTGNEQRNLYLAMMMSVDEGVGMIIDVLKKKKIYENTLIFFHSDNGGIPSKGGNNGDLRGEKADLYEGGIRVPFIVSWPKEITGGKTNPTPVMSFDIYTTSVAAAGKDPLSLNPLLDGRNMLPLLKGEEDGPLHDTLFWNGALRHGNYKLILNGNPDKKADNVTDTRELYDLSQDIGEQRNLAQQMPEKLAELTTLFEAWKSKNIRIQK